MKKRYRGFLTGKQLSSGIGFRFQNAESFLKEAKILFDKLMFPRAAFLALSCIEEISKMKILFEMAGIALEEKEEWEKLWEAFYLRAARIDEIVETTEEFHELLGLELKDQFATFGKFHSAIREASMYVEFNGKDWRSPLTEIYSEGAAAAIEAAQRVFETYDAKGDVGFFKQRALEIKKEMKIASKSSVIEKENFIKRLLDEGIFSLKEGVVKDAASLNIAISQVSADLFK